MIGLVCLGYAVLNGVCAVFGTNVQGVVIRGVVSESSDEGPSYRLDYFYVASGRTSFGQENVTVSYFQAYATSGSQVQVRFIAWGYRRFSILVDSSNTLWIVMSVIVVAVSFNGMLLAVNFAAWVYPWRELCTYRHGEVTLGSIVSKQVIDDEGKRYFVTFCFADETGKTFTKEFSTRSDVWEKFAEGQPVTVLYNPKEPRSQCYVYEYGNLFVVMEGRVSGFSFRS
jgi:hypothetical protein